MPAQGKPETPVTTTGLRIFMMNIRIELLRKHRQSQHLLQTLEKDGWAVQREPDQFLSARHPLVADEAAARSRLGRLGLLTSRSLRIEFRPGGLTWRYDLGESAQI
jgi:hypothetical protein